MASAPILNRVPPAARQKLLTPVQAETASALRAMGYNKLLAPVMSAETVNELVSLGFARETMGGVTLTDTGNVRAQIEAGQ